MSEMVERIAIALWAYSSGAPWDAVDYGEKLTCRNKARAVLAAMREPPQSMIDEALGCECNGEVWAEDFPIIWRACIDAALNPKGPT